MSRSVVYSRVNVSLALRKEKAEALADSKKREVYKLIPELGIIDAELGKIGVSLARSALSSDSVMLTNAKKASEKLRTKRVKLLKANSISEMDLKPDYHCKECDDTGVTKKPIPTRCRCFKQMLINECYSLSNLSHSLDRENFEMFDIRLFSEEIIEDEGLSPKANMERIYRHALRFVESFGKDFSNLLLYGEPGLGKTFICNSIAKDLLDQGFTVLYLTTPRLMKVIEDARFNRDSLIKHGEILETADDADLLILDDLGTEFPSITASSALFDILNERLLKRKPTVISTNLTPDDLASQYSERLVSRFFGLFDALKFFGDDIRVKIKYNRLSASA